MCGIIFVNNQLIEDIPKAIEGYNILSNRGPDKGQVVIKTYKDTNRFFGFQRLTINDLTDNGLQPFDLNQATLLCNGEIYNSKELENKYKLQLKTNSDCECIIHLFEKIGFEKTINELVGDFAIVISTTNKTYVARDMLGVRPIFIGVTSNNSIAVASCARALAPFCDSMEQMLPGYMTIDNNTGQHVFKEYSIMKLYPQLSCVNENNIKTIIRSLLTESVEKRLLTDRPIGCLLSGGLDSSIIACLLCELLGPEKVRTYSIGIKGSEDLRFAKILATHLGTTHKEIIFTQEEGFAVIPNVIRDLETYDITTIRASIPMWLLSKYISTNTDDIVIFSGEGADELFAGYLYFHNAPNSEKLNDESLRLLKNMHKYDVLRADRSVSSHGLELRVPFLDKTFVSFMLTVPGHLKQPINGLEKHLLRSCFHNANIPKEILYRRKDGMSDGVSGNGKKWYECIQEYVEGHITDEQLNKTKFISKESMYYKQQYDIYHSKYNQKIEYWMPQWSGNVTDPSGRELEIFNKDIK
jgi:asparagine synthase (glutamine-hydrolysing)